MTCPTCDHTMQSYGLLESGKTLYWCPRCGAVSCGFYDSGAFASNYVPMLPGRVSELLNLLPVQVAHTLGVEEACRLPADRKLG